MTKVEKYMVWLPHLAHNTNAQIKQETKLKRNIINQKKETKATSKRCIVCRYLQMQQLDYRVITFCTVLQSTIIHIFDCLIFNIICYSYRPVGRAVTRSFLDREVGGSNLGPVKSDTVLPTVRHRCNISSKGAVLPERNDAEMGPAYSLHASAYYSEYYERLDLICYS